jgi:hypothetical protein
MDTGDHFMDKYNIALPNSFDYDKKYLLVKNNDINYIALRLKDSSYWGTILSTIFNINIKIVKDYESVNKPFKDLYNSFKQKYKIPNNFLDETMKCKYLNYYYSPAEMREYYNEWRNKSGPVVMGYTSEQYKVYHEITLENTRFNIIQTDHYMDEGCCCKACFFKRSEIASKIMRGMPVNEKIVHTEAKMQLMRKQVERINKINAVIRNNPPKVASVSVGGKNFRQEMSNVIRGKR